MPKRFRKISKHLCVLGLALGLACPASAGAQGGEGASGQARELALFAPKKAIKAGKEKKSAPHKKLKTPKKAQWLPYAPEVTYLLEDGVMVMHLRVPLDFLVQKGVLSVTTDETGKLVLRFKEYVVFTPQEGFEAAPVVFSLEGDRLVLRFREYLQFEGQEMVANFTGDVSYTVKDDKLFLQATVKVPFVAAPALGEVSLPDAGLGATTPAEIRLSFQHTVPFEGKEPELATGLPGAAPLEPPSSPETLTLNFSEAVSFAAAPKTAEELSPQPVMPVAKGLLLGEKVLSNGGTVQLGATDLAREKLKVALTLEDTGAVVKDVTVNLGAESLRLSAPSFTGQLPVQSPPSTVNWRRLAIAGKNHDTVEDELFLNPDLLLGERQITVQGQFGLEKETRESPLKVTARLKDGSEVVLWEGTVTLGGPGVAKVQVSTDGGGRWQESADPAAVSFNLSPQDRREYEIQARVVDELGEESVFPDRPVRVRYSAKRFEEQARSAFTQIIAAYNSQDRPGFLGYVSEEFRSNLSSLRSKMDLEQALSNRFVCCPGRVTAAAQSVLTEPSGKRATVYFNWTTQSDVGEATGPGQWQLTWDQPSGEYRLNVVEEATSFLSYHGAVSRVTLQAQAGELPADNQSTVRLSGAATDSSGLAVADGTRLNIQAQGGTAPAIVETQQGRFEFDFQAGATPGTARVSVLAGGVSATVTLHLTTHAPPGLPPEF